MKRIKNATQTSKTWVGMEIAAGEYYTLEDSEVKSWANDATVNAAIDAGQAVVNNGFVDFNPTMGKMYLSTPGRVSYTVANKATLINFLTYTVVANLLHIASRCPNYRNGICIVEVEATDKLANIRIYDMTNNALLGEKLNMGSGFHMIAVNNPSSDARIEFQVKESGLGLVSPRVNAIQMEWDN